MPEVTLYLHTHNDENTIRETMESILHQQGVKIEILIVDDCSDDNTYQIIKSLNDKRIRAIRNKNHMGRAYCKNLAVKKCRTNYLVHTNSNHILVYDAIKRLFNKINGSEKIGLVYSYGVSLDDNGSMRREKFHNEYERIRTDKLSDIDNKKELLYNTLEMECLRIYRKDVFDIVGKLNEELRFYEDYEFALRILEKFEVAHLPELLYFTLRKNSINLSRIKEIVNLPRKISIVRNLILNENTSYIGLKEYKNYKTVCHTLYNASYLRELVISSRRFFKKFRNEVSPKLFNPLFDKIYSLLSTKFLWLPIELFVSKNEYNYPGEKRIAYFIWQFPVISQTFVQREVSALINAGHNVTIISDIHSEDDFLEVLEDTINGSTQCLDPIDLIKLSKYKRNFFYRNPLNYLNLFFYVVCHQYHGIKSFQKDKISFSKAIYLAGILKENRINHIHSPWADNCAFISLIASKLLGVSCSVQARAHDIHCRRYLHGLPEKFNNAEFIITNTKYNVNHIKTFLKHPNEKKIKLIYNGLNLESFKPKKRKENLHKPIRILSVARLIEQKGLDYLLKSCKILKDRDYTFKCEIIGGTESDYTNHYILLKKLRTELGLDDCVNFLGPKPLSKVIDSYRNADIFVLPCVIAEDGSRDITPNSLIEAMAMKLPVVSTNVSGIPEIVDDGLNGLLVPPNSVNELTEAIIRLIEDEKIRRELGENARKKIEDRFDIKKNVIKYSELFFTTQKRMLI